MKPKIIINKNNIIILGHFSDIIKCAKMDLLCKIHNAILGNGYALIKYNKNFLQQLLLIDSQLSFACDSGSCSTSCSGDCSGCGGSCSSGCSTACGDCGSSCGDGCKGCSGGCEGCSGSCDGGCKGCGSGCASTCKGDCDGGCKGECKGCGSGCASGCTGCTSCTGGCGTSCGPCTGTCTNICGTSCDLACDNGCTSTENQELYENILTLYANLPLDQIIYATDMTNLETMVKNESVRRTLTSVSNNNETVGTLIKNQSVNKVITDLNSLGYDFDNKNRGSLTSGSEMQDYIQAIIDLYTTLITIGKPG